MDNSEQFWLEDIAADDRAERLQDIENCEDGFAEAEKEFNRTRGV